MTLSKLTAAAALFLALSATQARAEGLAIPLTIFASGAAADMKTTHSYLTKFGTQGAIELNPVINRWQNEPVKMLAIGAAVETFAAWGLHKWLGERHPRLEKNLLYSAGSFHFVMAARNTQLHKRFEGGVQ